MTTSKYTATYVPEPMGVGSIFYVANNGYSVRRGLEEHRRIEIVSETENGLQWNCHHGGRYFGRMNKRSKRFRYADGGRTHDVFTETQKDDREYATVNRWKIQAAIKRCDPAILRIVKEYVANGVSGKI